jgi:sortase A
VRIIIPALGLDAPVQPMGWRVVGDHTEWELPDNAAGHHIDSAFPGESGNVVISGHHNIGGRVFAQISRIGEPGVAFGLGDEIILEDEVVRRFVYRVTGWRRIPEKGASPADRQENASYLIQTDSPQLTLITCWPADSNTHRVIIMAALTEIRTP